MRRTGALLVPALLAAALTACGSTASKSSAGTAPSAPPPSPSAATPTPTAAQDPVASCATKIDNWITTTFLLGKDDLGDYQEMGLSSSEGLALRNLEQQLGKTITAFPATPPADLHFSEVQACQAAGAGAPSAANWQ
jgi:hypothetical protein